MNAIQQRVLADAITRLDTLGVKYAIVDLDGVKHGELELAAEQPEPRPKRNNYRQHGYRQVVDDMQIGDVRVFDVPDGLPRENLRSSIQSRAIRHWGPGSMMTAFNADGQIEVMRLK